MNGQPNAEDVTPKGKRPSNNITLDYNPVDHKRLRLTPSPLDRGGEGPVSSPWMDHIISPEAPPMMFERPADIGNVGEQFSLLDEQPQTDVDMMGCDTPSSNWLAVTTQAGSAAETPLSSATPTPTPDPNSPVPHPSVRLPMQSECDVCFGVVSLLLIPLPSRVLMLLLRLYRSQ